MWKMILIIGCAGAVGGLINAIIANEGLMVSHMEKLVDGQKIFRLGSVGNVLIGVVTAIVLTGLYSPAGSIRLTSSMDGSGFDMNLSMLAGAVLSGIGGARLLSNELDKKLDKTALSSLSKTVNNLTQQEKP